MNLKKELGIAIEVRKLLYSQLKPVRNSYLTIMQQPLTVSP